MREKMRQETTGSRPEVDPFTDPVRYLMGLGIEAELVESREADLPSAA